MKIKELVNTCQNIWEEDKLFITNKELQIVILTIEGNPIIENNIWTILKETNYLLKIRDYEVLSWSLNNNKLTIQTNW